MSVGPTVVVAPQTFTVTVAPAGVTVQVTPAAVQVVSAGTQGPPGPAGPPGTLPNTGTPGTYGDATHFVGLTTDAQGRVTAVSTFAVPATGVATFNTRTGAVVLAAADVDAALPADVVQTDVANTFTVGPQTITADTGHVGLIVQADGTDSQQWKDSGGAVHARVLSTGAFSDPTGVSTNERFGNGALASASLTGARNAAFGNAALAACTTGAQNLAVGASALNACTTGGTNMALGDSALLSLTTGAGNVAVGQAALRNDLAGQNNVAIGTGAAQNTTASSNVAVGYHALFNNTTGAANVGVGLSAGAAISTGGDNVCIGDGAGNSTTITGSGNILIGVSANVAAGGQNFGVTIGYEGVCAANEFGFSRRINVQTGYGISSTSTRPRADFTDSWIDSTDATRKARRVFNAWDTLAREVMRGEADGAAARVGFLGATAVARPAVTGSRGGNAGLASLLTALASLGLITDSTSA